MSAQTVAALDIGTNTVLMLIVRSERVGSCRVVLDRHAIARLGAGVDATGVIAGDAIERLRTILGEHRDAAKEFGVTEFTAVGTSALRDARNRANVIEVIKAFGIDIRVISGVEEAELTFRGGIAGLRFPEGARSIAVLDIGGGSTEIALGSPEGFARGQSIEIGAVRITERYFPSQLRKPAEIAQARAAIAEAIDSVVLTGQPNSRSVEELVAVAGTPTSLAAITQGMSVFDPSRIHGYVLTRAAVAHVISEIAQISVEEMKRRYPVVNAARADILLAGSLILEQAMDRLTVDRVVVSTRGLRYGVAIDALEKAYGVGKTAWSFGD